MPDYYEVLGVSPTATQEDIRAAYLKLASAYHPDKHSGNPLQDLAEKKLQAINEAYEILSDPERRADYERARLLESDRVGGRPGPAGSSGGTWANKLGLAVGGFLLLFLLVRFGFRAVGALFHSRIGWVILGFLAGGAVLLWMRTSRRRRRGKGNANEAERK